RQLPVHAAHMLGDVGEAETPLRQLEIVFGPDKLGRQADRVENAPELVLRMGVIGAARGRHRSRRRAAEDYPEAGRQDIRQDMHGRQRLRIDQSSVSLMDCSSAFRSWQT